jgi:O-antigen ligase
MKAILNKKVYFVLLILVIASLPWHEHLNGACTLLLMLWTFLYNIYYRPAWHEWRERSWMLLHWAWYALFAIGLLWTADYSEGIFNLEVHMLLVLVPWMWATVRYEIKQKYFLLMSFLLSASLALGVFIWNIYQSHLAGEPLSMKLITEAAPFHHGFIGMYWCSAILIATLVASKSHNWLFKGLYGVGIVIFLAGIIMANAKGAILAIFAIIVMAVILRVLSKKLIVALWGIGVPLLLVSFVLAIHLWDETSYSFKLNYLLNYQSPFDNILAFLKNSFYHRLGQWHCGVEVWTQDWQTFLFGVGTGDATQALNACYTANDWDWLQGYSTHNEFLEEAVRHGLIGLLLLLAVFLYPVIRSIRRGNYWYVLQSVAFFVALMVDCYLSNQKGIVWYMWIGSLWYWLPAIDKK